jgi:hypothetical protein
VQGDLRWEPIVRDRLRDCHDSFWEFRESFMRFVFCFAGRAFGGANGLFCGAGVRQVVQYRSRAVRAEKGSVRPTV